MSSEAAIAGAALDQGATIPKEKRAAKGGDHFYIPSLDGIRAVACLIVFFGHAFPERMLRIIPAGFGVTVFFVLSGFLITTLLRKEFDATADVSLKHFYLRRVLRILPPFYIVLVVTTILTRMHWVDGRATWEAIGAYALHMANYYRIYYGTDDIPGGTSVYWSLSVEEHFYLLFPLIYIAMRRLGLDAKKQLFVVLGLCTMVLAWRIFLHVVLDAGEDRLAIASDTRVDSILFGCALAIYGNPVMDKTPRISDNTWRYVLLPLGFVALGVTSLVRQPLFHDAVRSSLQGIALIPFFVVVIRFPNWGPIRILNTRPARFMGLISYTFYLSHRAVLKLVGMNFGLPWAVVAALALPITILWCYGVYLLVEEPCARLRKRLTSAPRAPKAVPAT
jgi:peptidoglycan/LPS O-acetylase OafA/YrhL